MDYEAILSQVVAPWNEDTLRWGLHQLVEAEFLYQQGLPPQATYCFKHALFRDTECVHTSTLYRSGSMPARTTGSRETTTSTRPVLFWRES